MSPRLDTADRSTNSMPPRVASKEFDSLQLPKRGKVRIAVRRASYADIDSIYETVCERVGALADIQVIKDVAARNCDNVHVIVSQKEGRPLGCFAQIMLRKSGLIALTEGHFNGFQPAVAHLAVSGERPAAIYLWAVVASGRAALGISQMSAFLQRELYRRADLYTVPTTSDGLRVIKSLGFEPLERDEAYSLFCYRRRAVLHVSEAA